MCVGGFNGQRSFFALGEYFGSLLAQHNNGSTTAHGHNPTTNTVDKYHTIDDSLGEAPVPHDDWIYRLGFQQSDPVTDFRSGGILSLALCVHIAEACPHVHCRFFDSGDAAMMPFGLTSINITDMLAKMLMLSKAVDKMDALLSHKPFWGMFQTDPHSILVLQEISMEMLCDIVTELQMERVSAGQEKVTVFDFAQVLDITQKRVKDDLLGSGPRNVVELRQISVKVKEKYKQKCIQKSEKLRKKNIISEDDDGSSLRQLNEALVGSAKLLGGAVVGTTMGFMSKLMMSNNNNEVKRSRRSPIISTR